MTWEYLTGFFDADGSISLLKNNQKERRSVVISFHNNELDILNEIKNFLEIELQIKGYLKHKKAKKKEHKDQYDLRYFYQHAMRICTKLKSKHPKKIHRINTALEINRVIKRNGKYTKEESEHRDLLEEKFFQIF